MRRFWAILLVGLGAMAVRGQEKAPVSLQTFPKQLTLAGGETQRILAVVSVTGDSIRDLKLSALPGPGVSARVGKPPAIPDGFRGDLTWPVTITKADDGRASSDVTLQASYASGDPPKMLAQSAFTTLAIALKSRPKVEDVISGAIEASFTKLEERRPQVVYLTLTNISDVPITVTSIAASLPDFATIATPDGARQKASNGWASLPIAAGTSVIQPRQGFLARYRIEIPENTQVLSGKYLLLLRADVRYQRDGFRTQGTVVVKREFQVGVLGEDEFVGITSVPFLVLPGFIFITAGAILLGRFWPRWPIALDYKKPEYYFLSVLSAFGAIFLYARISPFVYMLVWRVNMSHRDMFSGYSLADIINVWLLAVSAAVVPWVLGFGFYSLVQILGAWVDKGKVPAQGDTPEIILEKLARAHKTFDLRQVTVAGSDLWELPLRSPDSARKWISGRIEIGITDGTGEKVESELNEAMRRTDDPAGLSKVLEQYREKVKARWEPEGGPLLIDKKDAPLKQGEPESFVHLSQ